MHRPRSGSGAVAAQKTSTQEATAPTEEDMAFIRPTLLRHQVALLQS
jgi:hypothetical protein